MRAHRGKFDTSKPFRLVGSRTAWDSLKVTDTLFPASDHNDHSGPQQREQIVVPHIAVVPRLTHPKPNARVPLNYIRLPAALCLPRPDAYELSEVDWLFLQGLRGRFEGVSESLNEQFLKRVMVELERRAGRDNILPRSKGWIVGFIEGDYKEIAAMPNFNEFTTLIYNYWKSRREELRFPLWRPLWRPADNEFNHMLAFKAREKRSRNLRRTNRLDESDLIQELYDECQNAAMLCERIQLREELKLRNIHYQLIAFAEECKAFIEVPPIDGPLPSDPRQRVRAARVATEDFKRRREAIEAQGDGPYTQVPNTRESISSFLANVVFEAQRHGMGHDSLFPSVEMQVPALKAALAQTNRMIQELPQEEQQVQEREETASFSMRRYGNMLVRSLSSDEEEREGVAEDYLASQRRRVARCYFGDDDQLGDTRDLRKVINSSFKRFLQSAPSLNHHEK